MKKTYIDISKAAHKHLSWELLASISNCTVDEYKEQHNKVYGAFKIDCRPFSDGVECPFGERDLMNDTCYLGSGLHKCKYFVRYEDGDAHGRCIVCSNPNKPIVIRKGQPIQLSLFTDF